MSGFTKQDVINKDPEDLVELAKLAEAAERYEDMCTFMSALVDKTIQDGGEDLSVECRNLLSVAFKNVVGAKRASWRALSNEAAISNPSTAHLVNVYKEQVEVELKDTCEQVIHLVKKLADFGDSSKVERQVFYLKMAGDYYRYLTESNNDQETANNAKKYYAEAYHLATEDDALASTHPIRLGLALNYSVCHFEILKDKKMACELAKKAFDDAISKLDKLDESDYKDSTLIMQLLRDNLTLWTTDNDGGVEVEDLSDEEN
jgi:hypothetical protein